MSGVTPGGREADSLSRVCRFGRKTKEKSPQSDWPVLSTIVRAEERLKRRGDITPARTAGLIYRHSDANAFLKDLDRELRQALHSGQGATRTGYRVVDDSAGGDLKWVVLEDARFADLASSVYTVGNAMASNGAADRLLAAVFLMNFTHGVREGDSRSLLRSYWIFRYDRHAYYPFVPTGNNEGDRDRPSELQLARLLRDHGLEVDRSLEDWRGLWGIPF